MCQRSAWRHCCNARTRLRSNNEWSAAMIRGHACVPHACVSSKAQSNTYTPTGLLRRRGDRHMGAFFSLPANASSTRDLAASYAARQPYLFVVLMQVGFDVVDRMARNHGITWERKLQSKALVAHGTVAGCRIVMCKPMAYMNVSGESVGPLSRFYKVAPEQIIVIYDDLDSELGDVKFKPKGGHGGHNGMRSIISKLQGNKDFPRVKVGIGRPPGQMPVPAFVLSRFDKAQLPLKDAAIDEAVRILESLCHFGLELTLSGKRAEA